MSLFSSLVEGNRHNCNNFSKLFRMYLDTTCKNPYKSDALFNQTPFVPFNSYEPLKIPSRKSRSPRLEKSKTDTGIILRKIWSRLRQRLPRPEDKLTEFASLRHHQSLTGNVSDSE